ncbi:hypothetical protein ACMFMF_002852 [Clarireedia jacksonii]
MMFTTPILLLSALATSVLAAPTEKRATDVVSGIQWKVSNFTRLPCVFTDTAASSASTHSFSSIPCAAPSSSWQINWGYNTDGDFAVMTVVNTVDSEDAFL